MAVEFIDFSCKHDILIRNDDGSLRPMDEPYFENEQIDADTWRVLSSGDYCYIVRGEGEAFAIDCGYGAGNIRKYMESVAGVPVPCVVNSHDHFDHTGCNAYFDKAYMSELCVKYATVPFPSFEGIDFHADEYERIAVKDGDIIPLPGRELVAIQITDHAPTSMMYLDRKNRILFSGDEIFGMPFKPLSGGLTSWVKGLGKIKAVWDDFDVAYGGNGRLDKSHIKGFIDVAEYALTHPEAAQKPRMGGPGGPPREVERDAEGHIIFGRMAPHPGDRTKYDPCDRSEMDPSKNMAVEYNGFRIMFNPELIND